MQHGVLVVVYNVNVTYKNIEILSEMRSENDALFLFEV